MKSKICTSSRDKAKLNSLVQKRAKELIEKAKKTNSLFIPDKEFEEMLKKLNKKDNG